jgi:hypothetical protein
MANIEAKIDACLQKMDDRQERMEANMNAWREGNKACLQQTKALLERKELTTVEMAILAVHQEVETIRALKGRSGDRRLAVRRRRRLTRRAIPALREGRSHKGPTVKKRRRKGSECNNDIRNRDARRQLRQRKERISCRIFRKTVELDIKKRIVGSSAGLRDMSDWTLGRCLRNERRDVQTTAIGKVEFAVCL